MSALLWLLVPLAPLLALLLLRRAALARWHWLGCLPAAVLLWLQPASLELALLWPGARWGLLDGSASVWLGFSALLWAIAGRYAAADLAQPHSRRFWWFWQLALAGNLLLVIAEDVISFYVGFTLMSLSAYGLVVHKGTPQARRAGRLYLQLAVLGEMLVYAGLLLQLHAGTGSLLLADWRDTPLAPGAAALLLVGFGLKAGFWPLHLWLPLAHPVAPAAASAVLSGVMLKAGILGLWRMLPSADPLLAALAPLLLGVGLCSAFYGVLMGLRQAAAKSLLAWSSVSQLGWLLVILALGWQSPALNTLGVPLLALYTTQHALAKGALFMAAGLATHQQLGRLGVVLAALPALALAGLPLTSGAALKQLLKQPLQDWSTGLSWLASLGSLGTALLLLRLLWLLQHQAGSQHHADIRWRLTALLCLAPLLLWLWPPLQPALLDSLQPSALLAQGWPLLLALLLGSLALQQGWQWPAALRPRRQPVVLRPSLWLKRQLQRPPLPALQPRAASARWRALERRWNQLWRSWPVSLSGWLLLGLLLLGWWL